MTLYFIEINITFNAGITLTNYMTSRDNYHPSHIMSSNDYIKLLSKSMYGLEFFWLGKLYYFSMYNRVKYIIIIL